jgi:PilZ domain
MLARMVGTEQRQHPRLGLGVPVTLLFLGHGEVEAELQDISRGGCFFKSSLAVSLDRRISVVLSAIGGKTCQASGRVVRTVAYKGFAVLFDQDEGNSVGEFIRDLTPLPQESRAALLTSVLKPEIQIY